MESPPRTPPAFLRQSDVLRLVPFSAATLWRVVRAGTFPAPVRLAPRVTAWRAEDIHEWMKSCEPSSAESSQSIVEGGAA